MKIRRSGWKDLVEKLIICGVIIIFCFSFLIMIVRKGRGITFKKNCEEICAPFIYQGQVVDEDSGLTKPLCVCDSKDGLVVKNLE